ncbi:MAG: class I SAM-dependent methyltransferase [Chloroflexi bacterium]|nr:class I SAM-dependent methyltransferase [Chloroflexota bacterium]
MEGSPWIAYRQFSQHFLAPLCLAAYTDVRLTNLASIWLDGIPLDLASKMLPRRTYLKLGIMSHIHLQARAMTRASDPEKAAKPTKKRSLSRMNFEGILDSLGSTVRGLRPKQRTNIWENYEEDVSYTEKGMSFKIETIEAFIERIKPSVVWDLGANTGRYSRIAGRCADLVVSIDSDAGAIEHNYDVAVREKLQNMISLRQDMTNPTPDLGWAGQERVSLEARGPADLVMALALVHHLAIGANVPINLIADYFAELGNTLIIEFVPKEDHRVETMLSEREDIFTEYNRAAFEHEFSKLFTIEESVEIVESVRVLYLMRKRVDSASI